MLGLDGETLRRHDHRDVAVDSADVGRDLLVGKVVSDPFAAVGQPQCPGRRHQRGLRVDPGKELIRGDALGAVMST